jgi:hypothetical protein
MVRSARRTNLSVGSVLEEAEQNLLSAFVKSTKTVHNGLKGDARASSVADFLRKRLPSGYGVECKGEVVAYLDQRSGEIDVVIYDRVRNAVLSEDPLWVPAESLLGFVEVKSTLTVDELRKSFLAAKKISSLRPFKRNFTLAGPGRSKHRASDSVPDAGEVPGSLRCFRTIFAFGTNLSDVDWLTKEWERIQAVTKEIGCKPTLIDRVLVLNRGMINPPSVSGTDSFESSSAFQQWFINLANFLARENGRRPPVDWQIYTRKHQPGWKTLI